MEIRDLLFPELEKRFPDRGLRFDPERPVAVFPAAHPEVGDVYVSDDGGEVRVSIGEITHGHFNPWDVPDEEVAEQVTSQVVDFLEELFHDRVLLFCSRISGGWQMDKAGIDRPELSSRFRQFRWSGPIKKKGA